MRPSILYYIMQYKINFILKGLRRLHNKICTIFITEHSSNSKGGNCFFLKGKILIYCHGCSMDGVPKNWCFHIVVLEKTPESPLDGKEIKPVDPKENEPWKIHWRTDAKAEAPIFWSLDRKSWKRSWNWERWKAKGEWNGRGWDG